MDDCPGIIAGNQTFPPIPNEDAQNEWDATPGRRVDSGRAFGDYSPSLDFGVTRAAISSANFVERVEKRA